MHHGSTPFKTYRNKKVQTKKKEFGWNEKKRLRCANNDASEEEWQALPLDKELSFLEMKRFHMDA